MRNVYRGTVNAGFMIIPSRPGRKAGAFLYRPLFKARLSDQNRTMSEETNPAFTLHAHSLGVLCIAWAALDRHLTDLLGDLIPCRASIAHILSSEIIAQRCEAIKKTAYAKEYQREWCELLSKVMDKIGGDIGPRRNRFIHDYWSASDGPIQRLDKRARLESAGAHLGKQLVYSTWHEHLPTEVDSLSAEVSFAILAVQSARMDVLAESGGQLPKPWRLTQIAPVLLGRSTPKKNAQSGPS